MQEINKIKARAIVLDLYEEDDVVTPHNFILIGHLVKTGINLNIIKTITGLILSNLLSLECHTNQTLLKIEVSCPMFGCNTKLSCTLSTALIEVDTEDLPFQIRCSLPLSMS